LKGYITGIGISVPKKIVPNSYFEERLDTSDEWIFKRTGISKRHFVEEEKNSDLAVEASKNALKNSGCLPKDLDRILVATCTPDYKNFPNQSSQVQDDLGAINAGAADINAACAGFTSALEMAFNYYGALPRGKSLNYLVIGVDCLSKCIDMTDRGSAILFGDGAGGVVIRSTSGDNGIIYSDTKTDGSQRNLIIGEFEGTISMNGKAVYGECMNVLPPYIKTHVNKAGFTLKDLDHIIFHQANQRMIEALASRLELPMHKVFSNINQYGNTSAASIPIALHGLNETGRLKKGNLVALVGFGAGFNYGITIMKWN